MNKPTVPVIPIELDKQRTLRIDFNALSLVEEKTGKNALSQELWENINASNVSTFLWACLIHEDKQLKLEDVRKEIHPGNVREIIKVLNKANKAHTPESDGEETEKN